MQKPPFGAVKVYYDRIMNRKHKMVKLYGLTLRKLRLNGEIFRKYMNNSAYYDKRTRMPKGWKRELPMMYGFSAIYPKGSKYPLKTRSIIVYKHVVNGILYVETVARYHMRNIMIDWKTGKVNPDMDWESALEKTLATKTIKRERFIVDMTTFDCHKVLWSKDREKIFKKLLTFKGPSAIPNTKEPDPNNDKVNYAPF